MKTSALILPGIGNSGPGHWQTLWEHADPSFVRVEQDDWDRPLCADWVATLESAVSGTGPDIVLVAHSLGCTLVSHWARHTQQRIRGALLVAPPDPEAPSFPAQASGFAPMPLVCLPFPSILVMSTDDPYGSPAFARTAAEAWGSRLVNLGGSGHINAQSGLGAWEEGLALYRQLAA